MWLEFYQELFLTAVISLLFAFLLSKISGGERHEDVLNSGEELRRQADEGVIVVADACRTGDQLIVEAEEHSGAIQLVQEIFEEKKVARVISGEAEEKISEKMEESESDRSCSGFKIGLNPETEIGSGGGEGAFDESESESLLIGEDDWEGIERSELEKLFRVASEYSTSPSGSEAMARLSGDLQMELYGLHKIATEGACYEARPSSLKASARARWHAWQKLGSMTPEVAMEQYINLLTRSIPGFIVENYGAKLNRVADIPDKWVLNTADSVSSLQIQLSPAVQM